jgi:hypothetical protein
MMHFNNKTNSFPIQPKASQGLTNQGLIETLCKKGNLSATPIQKNLHLSGRLVDSLLGDGSTATRTICRMEEK